MSHNICDIMYHEETGKGTNLVCFLFLSELVLSPTPVLKGERFDRGWHYPKGECLHTCQGGRQALIMKEYAESFYKSKTWQDCRNAYARSRRHLCERCLSHGIYKTGEIVHHKTHITPANINDPTITLNFDNLELLCRDCHAQEHRRRSQRVKIDELGRVLF